jgi:hypothetical protein
MRIAIVDGQGGGVGRALTAALSERIADSDEIIALGTNSLATGAMLKAGAKLGATGENAIVVNVERADVIAGPIGIIAANAMLGELTPAMARAIGASTAVKVLIPQERCGIIVAGVAMDQGLQSRIDEAVERILGLKQK